MNRTVQPTKANVITNRFHIESGVAILGCGFKIRNLQFHQTLKDAGEFMAYGGKTRFYQIPYMITNDFMTQDEEQRCAEIIDSLLFVATYGATRAIIEDASYTIQDSSTDPCILNITPIGMSYVFILVVNGRLAYRTEPIQLSLTKGSVYYVYCVYTDEIDTSPESCQVIASTEELNDTNHVLLCTVDLTGTDPIIDTDTNKQYLQSITAHTMDSTNPHGTTLSQDTLRIMQNLFIKEQEILPVVYYNIEASTGTTATIVSVDGMIPVFVTTMISDLSVGNVACVINGDNTISVTNDGATGLPIKLKIEGRYQ